MNINEWIKDNSYGLKVGLSDMDGCPDEVKFVEGCAVVRVTDLIKLLNTHAVVPREPSDEILSAMERDNKYKDYRWAEKQYKRAIKTAEQNDD